MTVSRRQLGNLVAEHLAVLAPTTIGYYGQIGRPLTPALAGAIPASPPVKSSSDPRVKPYFVLYPGAGTDGPDTPLCGTPDGLTWSFRITAAAGDVEDFLALVDRIDARLIGWAPIVAGYLPGRVGRQPGYDAPQLVDEQVTPPRVYTLLQYQLTL